MEDLILFIKSNIIFSWSALGALLIIIETFFIPAMGMLFLGIAAFSVAILIYSNMIEMDHYLFQVTFFLFATIIWTKILWKFTKKIWCKKEISYQNITGSIAQICGDDLKKYSMGKVKWSGTIMNAVLDENESVSFLPLGTEVRILQINGNILTVASINHKE